MSSSQRIIFHLIHCCGELKPQKSCMHKNTNTTYTQTYKHKHTNTNKQTYKQTNIQTNIQTTRTYKQTNTTNKHIIIFSRLFINFWVTSSRSCLTSLFPLPLIMFFIHFFLSFFSFIFFFFFPSIPPGLLLPVKRR